MSSDPRQRSAVNATRGHPTKTSLRPALLTCIESQRNKCKRVFLIELEIDVLGGTLLDGNW